MDMLLDHLVTPLDSGDYLDAHPAFRQRVSFTATHPSTYAQATSGHGSPDQDNSPGTHNSPQQQQQQQQAVPSLPWHLQLQQQEAKLLLEVGQLVASLLFILLYVWSTYSPVVPGSPRYWLDLGLCLVFAADYVHRILAGAHHPVVAALSPLNIIDLLSFAPTLLGAGLPLGALGGLDLRWFRIFRALRLLRLSLLSGNVPQMRVSRTALLAGSINVPLLWLVASVVSWLFTSASLVHLMEHIPWHDALYFVTSTLTTVGYGDVVVRSSLGRLVVLVMMAVGVVMIPVRASQLYSRIAARRITAGVLPASGWRPGLQRRPHVVLSGGLSDVRGFNDFLQDCLLQVAQSPQWSKTGLQLVCLCSKPSYEFLALQELHERDLTLVEGSAFNESDLLDKGALPTAAAALVLADRFCRDVAAEDTDVQFRVWAIKSAAKRVPLCVQVLRHSSMALISPFLDPSQDVLLAIESTRLRLLALSCLVPGASTLLGNLLRASGHTPAWTGAPASSTTTTSSSSSSSSSSGAPSASQQQQPGATLAGRRWLREYADGCHQELYFCAAGPQLHGLAFHTAAEAAYAATGALLVGMSGPSGGLQLHPPVGMQVHQGQDLVVLAPSQQCAEAAAAGEELEEALLQQAGRVAATGAATYWSAGAEAPHQPSAASAVGPWPTAAAAAAAGGPAAVLMPVVPPGEAAVVATVRVQPLGHWQGSSWGSEVDYDMSPASGTAGGQPVVGQPWSGQPWSEPGQQQQQQWQQVQQQQQMPDLLMQPQSAGAGPPHSDAASSGSPHSSLPAAVSNGMSSNGDSSNAISAPPSNNMITTTHHISSSGTPGHNNNNYSSSSSNGNSSSSSSSRPSAGWSHLGSPLATSEEELELHPCVANWSGAFESDSVDELQLCSEDELQEAAAVRQQQSEWERQQQQQYERLQYQQRQQGRQQQQPRHQPPRGQQHSSSTAQLPTGNDKAAAGVSGTAGQGWVHGRASSPAGEHWLNAVPFLAWAPAYESDSLDESDVVASWGRARALNEAAPPQRQPQQQQQQQSQQQHQQTLGAMASQQQPPPYSPPPPPQQQQQSWQGAWAQSPAAAAWQAQQVEQQQQQQQQQGQVPPQAQAWAAEQPVGCGGPPSSSSHYSGTTSSNTTSSGSSGAALPATSHPPSGVWGTPPSPPPPSPAPAAAAATSPAHLSGHVILAGCPDSFPAFARQLVACCAQGAAPPLVVLHPDCPSQVLSDLAHVLAVQYVPGRASDPVSLQAAGAPRAKCLVYVGSVQRPHAPAEGGDSTGGSATDHGTIGRAAVLADSEALLSCYGVGEQMLPDMLHAVVELGFTSSVRFLQPGLLLHGVRAPGASGSVQHHAWQPVSMLSRAVAAVGTAVAAQWKAVAGRRWAAAGRRRAAPSASDGKHATTGRQQQQSTGSWESPEQVLQPGSLASGYSSSSSSSGSGVFWGGRGSGGAPAGSGATTYLSRASSSSSVRPWTPPPPSAFTASCNHTHQQQQQKQQPRTSWRHRKVVEALGRAEGLTEWQMNSYYAAGRVLVPALLDTFTCQALFKRHRLLQLLQELAGDDGRPGGAALQLQPVPTHLVGHPYSELVTHLVTRGAAQGGPLLPLGLLRRKAENRGWRLPYVAAHPRPDVVLDAADGVYVLRQQL